MKKVLIALDYNPTAQQVAEAGFLLAKSMNADVILLHVITDPVFYIATDFPLMGFEGNLEMYPTAIDNVEGLKNATLKFLNKSKEHLGDESIQTLVKEGDFADAILDTAKELHVDIIVMGSHSKKWLENILVGSVTEKVLRHTLIPLYIIPIRKHS